jgi:hypothetical protein
MLCSSASYNMSLSVVLRTCGPTGLSWQRSSNISVVQHVCTLVPHFGRRVIVQYDVLVESVVWLFTLLCSEEGVTLLSICTQHTNVCVVC